MNKNGNNIWIESRACESESSQIGKCVLIPRPTPLPNNKSAVTDWNDMRKSEQWPKFALLVDYSFNVSWETSLGWWYSAVHMSILCSDVRWTFVNCDEWAQCQRWGKVEKQKIHTWIYLSSFPSAQHVPHHVIPRPVIIPTIQNIYKIWCGITSQKYVNITIYLISGERTIWMVRCARNASWKMWACFKWIKAITCTFL